MWPEKIRQEEMRRWYEMSFISPWGQSGFSTAAQEQVPLGEQSKEINKGWNYKNRKLKVIVSLSSVAPAQKIAQVTV